MRYVAVMFGAAGIMFLVAQVLTLMSPGDASSDEAGGRGAQSVASQPVEGVQSASLSANASGTSNATPQDTFSASSLEQARTRQEAARRAAAQQESSIQSMFGDIQSEQRRIEQSQSGLDARVAERLRSAPEIRVNKVQEDVRVQLDEVVREKQRQRQVLTEVYSRMSVDGVAAVVDDLVESGRIDSATTVLSVLGDRSAARVLAIVAGPRPDAAALITARLQDSSVR